MIMNMSTWSIIDDYDKWKDPAVVYLFVPSNVKSRNSTPCWVSNIKAKYWLLYRWYQHCLSCIIARATVEVYTIILIISLCRISFQMFGIVLMTNLCRNYIANKWSSITRTNRNSGRIEGNASDSKVVIIIYTGHQAIVRIYFISQSMNYLLILLQHCINEFLILFANTRFGLRSVSPDNVFTVSLIIWEWVSAN